MSDDLVKRLKARIGASRTVTVSPGLYEDIRDAKARIEALEAENTRLRMQHGITKQSRDYQKDRAVKAKASQNKMANGLKHWKTRADAAERALAEAVEVMCKIASHPEKYDDGKRSYAVGWAFHNVRQIARAFIQQHEGKK